MAYRYTIVSRNRGADPYANVPLNVYIPGAAIKSVWEPMYVPRNQSLYTYIHKVVTDRVKASAIHIKEGLVYESKAAVWNNPLPSFDFSTRGQLNNFGGGTTTNKNTRRAGGVNPRNASLENAISGEKARLNRIWTNAYPAISKMRRQRNASGKLVGPQTAWEKKINAHGKANATQAEIEEKETRIGHKFLPVFLKNPGYYTAVKFSTLELRKYPAIFGLGKGKTFIEVDAIIHTIDKNGKHRFKLGELKKELGETGEEQAQQLRKAATLLRKWSIEILGTVPDIELYFAAGAAESFTAAGYSFNSEVGKNVQNWTPAYINSQVRGSSNHIVAIRTPVYLLTAVGFADLIRIHPDRMNKIRSGLTEAEEIPEQLKRLFLNKKITDEDIIPFLSCSLPAGRFRDAGIADILNNNEKLYINFSKLFFVPAQNDFARRFQAAIPSHWALKDQDKMHPTAALARVTESLGFIDYMEKKLQNGRVAPNKQSAVKKEIIQHYRYIVSTNLSRYLKNKNAIAARLAAYGNNSMNNGSAPNYNNPKFLKRAIRGGSMGQRNYVKRTGVNQFGRPTYIEKTRQGPPAIGSKKVSANNFMNEAKRAFLYRKGAGKILTTNYGPINNASVGNMSNTKLFQWVLQIKNALNRRTAIPTNTFNKYRQILNSTVRTRNVAVNWPGANEEKVARAQAMRNALRTKAAELRELLNNHARIMAAAPAAGRAGPAKRPTGGAPPRAAPQPTRPSSGRARAVNYAAISGANGNGNGNGNANGLPAKKRSRGN